MTTILIYLYPRNGTLDTYMNQFSLLYISWWEGRNQNNPPFSIDSYPFTFPSSIYGMRSVICTKWPIEHMHSLSVCMCSHTYTPTAGYWHEINRKTYPDLCVWEVETEGCCPFWALFLHSKHHDSCFSGLWGKKKKTISVLILNKEFSLSTKGDRS